MKESKEKAINMKKFAFYLLLVLGAFLIAAPSVAADSGTETKTTWQCYTNAYGQESCSEQVETTTAQEQVVIKERIEQRERVDVTEHEVVDAALTKDQMLVLMVVMVLGLAGVGYKLVVPKSH